MDPHLLRNIGIIAHIDAGKTTFTERLLYYTGVIGRMGEVHNGSATMDFMPEERERGITIGAACISCPWQDCLINVIDTPGHVDFTIEVERSLRVLDAAVGIFCGVAGVEPQSERVWKQAERFHIPRLAVINKMDREGASYSGALLSMQEKLRAIPAPVTVPYGEGEEFIGILDLVRREIFYFDSDSGGKVFTRLPFDEKAATIAAPWRERLVDLLTETDDALLEVCLSGQDPSPEILDASIRKATLAQNIVPVFAAAAVKNIGIQPVLDAIVAYLPSPLDMPLPPSVVEEKDEGGERHFCALVFKVVLSKNERILFVRLYTGSLFKELRLLNTRTGNWSVVRDLFRVYAQDRETLVKACRGDIVAITGVEAVTGDTLTFGEHIRLEPIDKGLPVISMVFETRTSEENAVLDTALDRALMEDPTLRKEHKDGRTLVAGMGELHLEVLRDRLQRECGMEIRLGNPVVVCREIFEKTVENSADLAFETAGQKQSGKIRLRFSPLAENEGVRVSFTPEVSFLPSAALEAVRRGIAEACASGNYGYPVVRCEALVLETGEEYTEDGLSIAAKHACAGALHEGGTIIEEPVMSLTVSVPNEHVGSVLALLGMSGANVKDCLLEERQSRVIADAPLGQLFGFATRLRSSTQGRADLFMEFSHYAPVHA